MAKKKKNKPVKLKCSSCQRLNYYTTKSLVLREKKLELSKYCKWCRKHTLHQEAKR